jgi:tripartite-type tricarboxylate transporter receptor subunit TctC
MNKVTHLLCASVALAIAGFSGVSAAQSYPTKPVRLIVPFPPGGSNDIVGRLMAQELTEKLGKQVVIDNRGGAGGVLGTEIAANADPDGHTLLIISVAYAFNPALYKLRFDPDKAFVPVAMLGTGPNALTVTPKLPVNSVKELIAMAKAQPGKLNYASAGAGSTTHLAMEMLKHTAGLDIVHVAYNGNGPAGVAVLGGQVQALFGSMPAVLPQAKAGKLRPLAVGTGKRSPALPDVPTVAESGYPGFEVSLWLGFFAPRGTPAPIINRVHAELVKIVLSPEMKEQLEKNGAEPAHNAASIELERLVRTEIDKYAKVLKAANIKLE